MRAPNGTFCCEDPEERFWPKVHLEDTIFPENGCMLWTGAKSDGYGIFWAEGRNVPAHRWVYERFYGPIPEGLQPDHLCRVRHCVNPNHLEPVTQKVNLNRGNTGHGRKFTKLSEADVAKIRERRGTQGEIAVRFGISQGHVSDILNGKKRA